MAVPDCGAFPMIGAPMWRQLRRFVTAPDGSRIPLRELDDIRIVDGPAQISREHASGRIVIEVSVLGPDRVGAVEEAKAANDAREEDI
jgi:Cu/Ag efflux pump CusA